MRSVYIETTVWSFAFAEDSPDYRADTLAFFNMCRSGGAAPCVSPVVLQELDGAPEPLRTRLRQLVDDVAPRMLPPSEEARLLASAFLEARAVPPSKPADAARVAHAFVAGCDVLVSWNFKHIANVRRAELFNVVARQRGFTRGLTIVTPLEVQDGL